MPLIFEIHPEAIRV